MDKRILNQCKGVCKSEKFKEYDLRYTHRNTYLLGYSRCRRCEFYIKGLIYCPCCSSILSIKPKNAYSKRLMNERLGVKRY